MNKQVHGIVTEDPAKAAAIGEAINFRSMLFKPVAEPCAGDLAEWAHFGSALLSIAFTSGDKLSVEGSAVMVGPGVALAAKHVFEPRLADIMASKDVPILHAVTEHGLQIWRLHQLVLTDTDVAILRIDLASNLPPENDFHAATLTTRTPKVGEQVQIAGFRSDSVEEGAILGQTRVGIGEVTAVYLTGRDKVMLPHPCIEVKCLTIGGMSGGPAFDENGMLLGVLTSSIEHEEGPSYVSLAWPTFGAKIESLWLPGMIDLPTSLIEMAAKGVVGVEKPEAFTIVGEGKCHLLTWS
ncbi:serine protease [Phenylobacterium sp.]|uniref:S1 family peptidase n=1 Tax=Phenylobacterium sp. TaxID=1871053 RepID=UPI0027164CE6|nr:serine protease [Phenylobacterium sp.]MDO8799426.1 serine protease [Phenylobacterium sp.]